YTKVCILTIQSTFVFGAAPKRKATLWWLKITLALQLGYYFSLHSLRNKILYSDCKVKGN
ncbi:hypothetical protein P3600_24835, partial [Vibrio parahaemolyticus]|nr:hypothetical protein [Vibrio parahaemolyticus]